MTDRELCNLAIKARQSSYSPYSDFRVGAALLTKGGKVYLGANIENASYGACICAERVAFSTAVNEGEKEFSAIAIAGAPNGEDIADACAPCGICRQVMAEFCDDSFKILLPTKSGYESYSLKELLPLSFTKSNLTGDDK